MLKKIDYYPFTLHKYGSPKNWQDYMEEYEKQETLKHPFFQNLPSNNWQARPTEDGFITLSQDINIMLGNKKVPIVSYVKIK